jgi:hypothetical protein
MVSNDEVSSEVSVNGAMRTDIHLAFVGKADAYNRSGELGRVRSSEVAKIILVLHLYMDDSLSELLTQLAGTLTILARESDKLAATLTRLDTEVEQLRDEVSILRSQLGMQAVPTCAPFSSLASETREHVDTACAAFYLGRKAQTLRKWACYETGPVRPVRIHGRLAWSVADLRQVGCR